MLRGKRNFAAPWRWAARNYGLRRLAAAEFEDQAGREFKAGHDKFRIGTALETVARIRLDSELAARRGNSLRIKPCGFDEDVARRLRAARLRAAHHAGNAERAFVVGDDDHLRIERVGLPVQRRHNLAVAREPRLHAA